MDGFPNGRRLEDDVTRIELQAVAGVALAAIGLWYDDFNGGSPVTQDLLDVLTYSTGVEKNDAVFQTRFPYLAAPWAGDGKCGGAPADKPQALTLPPGGNVGVAVPASVGQQLTMDNYPNPFGNQTTLRYDVTERGMVNIEVFDLSGRQVAVLVNEVQGKGSYSVNFDAGELQPGVYFARASNGKGEVLEVLKMLKSK